MTRQGEAMTRLPDAEPSVVRVESRGRGWNQDKRRRSIVYPGSQCPGETTIP